MSEAVSKSAVPSKSADDIVKKPIKVNQGIPLKANANQKEPKEISAYTLPEIERKSEIKTLQDFIKEKKLNYPFT